MVPIDSKGNLLSLRNQEPLWLVCVCVFSSASHKQTCCSMFCVIAMIEYDTCQGVILMHLK